MSGQVNALSVRGLRVSSKNVEILKGIDFFTGSASCIGIVGESGSGKTMLARSLMGLLATGLKASGEYEINNTTRSFSAKENYWRKLRGREIGLILQDPFTALDPLKKCGKQILAGVGKNLRKDFDLIVALKEVGLAPEIANRLPFELSGGQRQRVVIAAALATSPQILIADEATTALDAITQNEILNLLDTLRKKRNTPLILITHDLSLVRERTDFVFVLKDGENVESGKTTEVLANPKTDYAKMLIEASAIHGNSEYIARPKDAPLILTAAALNKNFGAVSALDAVSVEIHKGECVAIVGESGSGKTTLARCIVGLERADSGVISYFGTAPPQIVFQDPYSSLNPAHTIRASLTEAILAANVANNKAKRLQKSEVEQKLAELLALAEIPKELLERKPAKLSGGQRQRVAIARALGTTPDLLVCDESVSALDVLTQKHILEVLSKLNKERGLAILFITHDLSVAKRLAGRVYIMKDAKIVETGETKEIFEKAKAPYTRLLIDSAL